MSRAAEIAAYIADNDLIQDDEPLDTFLQKLMPRFADVQMIEIRTALEILMTVEAQDAEEEAATGRRP